MDELTWNVRGNLHTDTHPGTRFKHGLEAVQVRLDTREVGLTVSLTAEGELRVSLTKLGSHSSRCILQGTIQLEDGKPRLNSYGLLT